MKININTPADQIKKDARIRRITFWFCLIFGVLTFSAVPPFGFIFLVLAWISSSARKNDLKLLAQREQLDAAEAAAKAEAAARSAAARSAAAEAAAKADAEREAAFLSSHVLVKTIHTKVVGVTFQNDDGSDRQEILSYCFFGDQLELRPFVYDGAPAYAVFDGGEQIGNIPADTAQVIHTQAAGLVIRAEISEITGGDGMKYGCNILVKLYRHK